MTTEQVGGIVRALVAAAGGYFVGQGLIDAETMLTVGGAVTTIAVAVWSIWSKKKSDVAHSCRGVGQANCCSFHSDGRVVCWLKVGKQRH